MPEPRDSWREPLLSSTVSVVIPTYKRPSNLEQCLASLVCQVAEDFEVVVVDNAADQATKMIVERHVEDAVLNIRYVEEPRRGLHYARHSGVRAAMGNLLIFTDDDATFDANWILAYVHAFSREPEMAAAGGPVRPIWEAKPPEWLVQMMSRDPKNFGVLSLMEPFDEFRVGPDCFFFGVNLAIRKKDLYDAGGFNPDSFGSTWLGDGETGLLNKLRANFMKVGYVPEAVVYHHIPKSRLTYEYFLMRAQNQGAADIFTRYHPTFPRRSKLFLDLFRVIVLYALLSIVVVVFHQKKSAPLTIARNGQRSYYASQFKYIRQLMTDDEMTRLVGKTDWLLNE